MIIYAGGGGELRGVSQRVQLYTGAQINFGDVTPYLTYEYNHNITRRSLKISEKNLLLMRGVNVNRSGINFPSHLPSYSTATFRQFMKS